VRRQESFATISARLHKTTVIRPFLFAAALQIAAASHGFAQQRPPLSPTDIADIVTLERIEDRRDFDATVLARVAASKHPEIRRRAALAIARLYDPRGGELLRGMRADADTVVLATVVWATGQLVDTSAIGWLDGLLSKSETPVGVATEVAGAFGKIRTDDARQKLSHYLTTAAPGASTAPVVREALLSMGRYPRPTDTAAIGRWTKSPDVEIRWRAAWALFRPRDPGAIPLLLAMSKDSSADVRTWAIRGLSRPRSDTTAVDPSDVRDALLNGLEDKDRRVRTEATRALGTYTDATSLIQLILLLQSDDPWVAVSAAEGIAPRGDKARAAIPELLKATAADNPSWLRGAALTALAEVWLPAVVKPATQLAKDTSLTVRLAAVEVLRKLKVGGRTGLAALRNDPDRGVRTIANRALLELTDTLDDPAIRRRGRTAAFASKDAAVRAAAAQSISEWADAADTPTLLNAFAVAMKDSSSAAQEATIETLADIEARIGGAADAFFKRFPTAPSETAYGIAGRAFGPKTLAAWGTGRPIRTARTDADYKRIVETLIVPAYNRAPAPRLRWETTRGSVDTDLNTLDAPLASDYLLSLVAKGSMKHIRFERVVPNFVAQQASVLVTEPLQRDEVSRGRLIRGNLSWGTNIGNSSRFRGTRGAGAAYDTGPADYTFAQTPQPHNEGDFSALGQIIAGMDVVDLIQLGDYVKSVRVMKPGAK
jgi:HEAT repeat protein/cyclophilin family peptidyl-prolyl cis-trans isomerase